MADATKTRDPLKKEAIERMSRPETPARPFIHLRVHSAYSLLEGALQVGAVVGHAVKDECPAIAVTDTNNLFGALEFAQKAVKEGIQPIIGCQIDLAFSGRPATRSATVAVMGRRCMPWCCSPPPRPAMAIW